MLDCIYICIDRSAPGRNNQGVSVALTACQAVAWYNSLDRHSIIQSHQMVEDATKLSDLDQYGTFPVVEISAPRTMARIFRVPLLIGDTLLAPELTGRILQDIDDV